MIEIHDLNQLRQTVQAVWSAADRASLADDYGPLLEQAYLIRRVEEQFLTAFGKGQMNGTVHTCIGQEFSAVSVCHHLVEGDWITSNHRCHGHYIAHTGDWRGLIDELLGKAGGVCKGIGSSQHLFRQGFISNGPQGALLPVGTGIGRKLRETGNVVVSFIGEGTLGEGVTYEALNLAALLKVPQVFICENNFYSQSTPQAHNTAGRIPDRFRAFGLKTYSVNTWDLPNLLTTVGEAIAHARETSEPVAIVMTTYRLNAHSKGDDDRDAEERGFFRANDPITWICEGNNRLAQAFAGIDAEVEAYFETALAKPELSFDAYEGDEMPRRTAARYEPARGFDGRVIERINAFLREEAERGSMIIGEDIADPYGGAFKATKGIGTDFPDAIVSTPISEAGLVGVAAGYSLAGRRGIAEIMFGDFVTYAFDQIVNGISKYHHMYGKQASCPVTIRMPMGGKRGYGATHSQSLEKFLCGVDNVLVVALNSLSDPHAVMRATQDLAVPALIIENKTDYGRRAPAANPRLMMRQNARLLDHLHITPQFNKPHFSIVTYGEPARIIYDAYDQIVAECDALFDLFCLVKLSPMDLSGIARQVMRHEAVLAVEDGSAPFGISAEILAQLTEKGYPGKVGRLGAKSVPIPSPKSLEMECLVTQDSVIEAVRSLLHA